jgi:hypothetical protein
LEFVIVTSAAVVDMVLISWSFVLVLANRYIASHIVEASFSEDRPRVRRHRLGVAVGILSP